MKPEEIATIVKEAVTEAMQAHPCWMSIEDQATIRDVVQGAKYVKKSILIAAAGGILYMIAKAVMAMKSVNIFSK